MQSATIRVGDRRIPVTRQQVRRAMGVFNARYRALEPECGTGYRALDDKKRDYPPKRILRLAIGKPKGKFYGGQQTNKVFVALGFDVKRLTKGQRSERLKWKRTCPAPDEVVATLFSQTWSPVDLLPGAKTKRPTKKKPTSSNPGIYALAYTSKDIDGRRVTPDAIFYVGMSNHAGLAARLNQFKKAIECGHGHSGGNRFFTDYTHGLGYKRQKSKDGRAFYFATVPVPCVTSKKRRTCLDLHKMGAVAAAECHALARIKKETGKEPELNEQ